MSKIELDDFGRNLLEQVRDEVIDKWIGIIDGSVKAPRLIDWHNEIKEFQNAPQDVARFVSTKIVDSCIAAFLRFIDSNEEISVEWKGVDSREESDGLSGELYGDHGWLASFARNPSDEK